MNRRLLLLLLLLAAGFFLWRDQLSNLAGVEVDSADLPDPWPPVVGEVYPDLELVDHQGHEFRLSSLEGKIVILEPIGMNCPACQGFSGGNEVGGLGGFQPQRGALALERYLESYAPEVSLRDPDLVLLQLLLYDLEMRAPGADDARLWADHFPSDFGRRIVAAPQRSLISQASYDLIPGFQLLDRERVLLSDSSGHQPRHSLTDHLFPRLTSALR